MTGSRRVVCTPLHQLLEFLSAGQQRTDLQRAYHWLKTVTFDAMKLYPHRASVYFATMGEGDLLHLPAGYCFFEIIPGRHDFCGVRVPYISAADSSEFEKLNIYLLALEAPSKPLQHVVDCLELL